LSTLLLDIDGVLTSHRNMGMLDTKCIQILAKIVHETNCELVLSSTMRRDKVLVKWLKRLLREYGLTLKAETPVRGTKSEEIRAWVKENLQESALVLDDEQLEEDLNSILVRVNPKTGLGEDTENEILKRWGDLCSGTERGNYL